MFEVKLPMSLYCDNKAVGYIDSNHVFHVRNKHIEVDFHMDDSRKG